MLSAISLTFINNSKKHYEGIENHNVVEKIDLNNLYFS